MADNFRIMPSMRQTFAAAYISSGNNILAAGDRSILSKQEAKESFGFSLLLVPDIFPFGELIFGIAAMIPRALCFESIVATASFANLCCSFGETVLREGRNEARDLIAWFAGPLPSFCKNEMLANLSSSVSENATMLIKHCGVYESPLQIRFF